jgi:hypothetical protein
MFSCCFQTKKSFQETKRKLKIEMKTKSTQTECKRKKNCLPTVTTLPRVDLILPPPNKLRRVSEDDDWEHIV